MTQVRIGTIEDVESISNVLASSWKTAYRGIVHDEYLDALKHDHWVEFVTKGLIDGSIIMMIIEEDQEIIGVSVLGETGKKREINLISFYLTPEKIGQGFGHIFYTAIETELKNRGYQDCVIDVLENNTRASRFYEAHGYIDTGKEVTAVLEEQQYICKVMKKTLVDTLPNSSIIETSRLILREMTIGDLPATREIVCDEQTMYAWKLCLRAGKCLVNSKLNNHA